MQGQLKMLDAVQKGAGREMSEGIYTVPTPAFSHDCHAATHRPLAPYYLPWMGPFPLISGRTTDAMFPKLSITRLRSLSIFLRLVSSAKLFNSSIAIPPGLVMWGVVENHFRHAPLCHMITTNATSQTTICNSPVHPCRVRAMSNGKWLEAEPKETWLVANDNEHGKKWFGRTVQITRQDRGLSVAELASRVDLAEGTIRAIERGGRAPSEASGLRILAKLFTSDQWSKNHFGPNLHAVKDPETKAPVIVEFGAKVRGDNGSWSRDRTPEDDMSDRDNEILRKVEKNLLENPEKLQRLKGFFSGFNESVKTYVAHLNEPINDENLGKVTRRLPAITNLQADHLDKLLWLWGLINTGRASREVIDEVQRVDKILGSFFSEDELKEFSEDED